MSDKRRAEILAKRAKLEEMRKAKAARQAEADRRTSLGRTPPPKADDKDFDEYISKIIGPPRVDTGELTPSIPGTPSLSNIPIAPGTSPSRGSNEGSDRIPLDSGFGRYTNSGTDHAVDHTIIPRVTIDLIDIEQELFELPQKERVLYNKEVQTRDLSEENEADAVQAENELRERILRERLAEAESAAAREKELDDESVRLEKEIEADIRDLTEEERMMILGAPEFADFVDNSTKIIQRALNDNYDYIRDYTLGAESGVDDSEGKRVKRVCAFFDERYGKNRSITDVDWSPKYPEISCAAYNKNPAALNEPDGLVAIWNLHMLERPEFVLHSQSDVLSVTFSPFHSNLVFGGTYSGQILLWDMRSKHLPVLKTPLSAAGHTHPVYAMKMVGTQNAHNLITSSTDGLVCSWLVDMLAQPQESLELIHAGHNKTGEVAITTLDFPNNETTTFMVGTEEGNVYQAHRYDRAGAKAGLNQYDVYKGHTGPVMGLHFHPLVGPVDFSDLFLTCSVDWTVKLWRAKSLTNASGPPPPSLSTNLSSSTSGKSAGAAGSHAAATAPIYSFEEADDYVYDVKWHPLHPAMFGTVDGSGKFDLWNLNTDTEVPVVSTTVSAGKAVNKMQWDKKDGRRVALGGSDGKMYIYDIGDMGVPRESEWTDMQRTAAGLVGAGQGGHGDDGGARVVAGR